MRADVEWQIKFAQIVTTRWKADRKSNTKQQLEQVELARKAKVDKAEQEIRR